MNKKEKNILKLAMAVFGITGMVAIGVFGSWELFIGIFLLRWSDNLRFILKSE